MSVLYTIVIRNLSTDRTPFMIFTEPPKVDPGDNDTIFTNVFQRSDPTNSDGNGTAVFKVQKKTYAICLTSRKPLSAGTNVITSDWQQVNIGTYTQAADTVQVSYDSKTLGGSLSTAVKANTVNTPPGGFVMSTCPATWSYPTDNNFALGVGAMDGGIVQPLAVFPAKPNKTYNIFPITKFYVAPAGSHEVGDIIDVKTIPISYCVDFSGGMTTIMLDYGTDNNFHLAPF